MNKPAFQASVERANQWRARSKVRVYGAQTLAALSITALTFMAVVATVISVGQFAIEEGWAAWPVRILGLLPAALSFLVVAFAAQAARLSAKAKSSSDVYEARALGARASEMSWKAISYSVAFLILCALAWFMVVNDAAVSRTFFDIELIIRSAATVLKAFGTNVLIFAVSAVLILVWALVVAIARTLPGEAGRPIRTIAIIYSDLFRGLPAIITIYLIGFGLPLTNLPILKDLSSNAYAIIALTLTYGAYTSEVYRAGIESVHPSQIAAARSLGLSYFRTMRYVIVPQAVRGIIPPLMNNCISLQKDTALVAIIGTIDAFNQSKIIASNNFNLSAVTTVAIIFILITIPQARFVDKLIERDRSKRRSG
ncbi:amino acid ABC transporter permease [Microvirga sp. TS319]|uniref:amino acid ABC transporter permease n=1 Tax=Microvirga sp. TS319 TaxID=3241165 RepID=UPI00351A7F8A